MIEAQTSLLSIFIIVSTSSNIMHRFWEIEEMVRLLASDLGIRCKASASAVALACCSKRLSDIVLDPLWEEIEGLSRLTRCLPPQTWEVRSDEFVRTFVQLTSGGLISLTGILALPLRPRMGPIFELRSQDSHILRA